MVAVGPRDPPIKFAYINPASRAWRQLFVSRMKELCARYPIDATPPGPNAVHLQRRNGRIDGMNCLQGNLALAPELCAALPNVALSGEGLDEVTYRYEAFAQRHLHGLNHADGDWSDRLIALAHPISSAIFTPHTTLYGYLGMADPTGAGLYQAWRRGATTSASSPRWPISTAANSRRRASCWHRSSPRRCSSSALRQCPTSPRPGQTASSSATAWQTAAAPTWSATAA